VSETLIIDENRLFAPVRVGQIGGYAHIDTGARRSSVLQSYSGHFPKTGTSKIHGALAAARVSQVCVDEIVFLDEVFRDTVADVQPDSQGDLDAVPFGVTMALGCDVLLKRPLYLSFEQNEIGFLKSDMPAESTLKADLSLGLPILKVSLGDHVLDAVFDTGAGLSVLNRTLLTQLGEQLTEAEALEVEDAVGTKHKIPTFRCDSLAIGERLLGDCQFLVLDLGAIEQETGQAVDCIFGINAMMGRSWVIDSVGQRIDIV
jgi:hypothetical protein